MKKMHHADLNAATHGLSKENHYVVVSPGNLDFIWLYIPSLRPNSSAIAEVTINYR
jgi:hypothetical protein